MCAKRSSDQEISFFDSTRTGELTNRLSSDTSVVQNSVTNSVPMFCRYVFQIAGSLVVLMIISWKLTLVMLSVVPPVCIGTAFYAKAVQRYRAPEEHRDTSSARVIKTSMLIDT